MVAFPLLYGHADKRHENIVTEHISHSGKIFHVHTGIRMRKVISVVIRHPNIIIVPITKLPQLIKCAHLRFVFTYQPFLHLFVLVL